ncbi:MAG TPA: alpha/beta fold hydrolase [Burkholderiaceae bacterium]|nr:alpha/beta fold hydrolase [Burkholderiaceae bacterium]
MRPILPLLLAAAVLTLSACRPAPTQADALEPCRLPGIEREIRCGSVSMPEDPDAPAGARIDVRFAVVPAVARNARPDPVFVFAGGPGQAASQVIGMMMPVLAELNARRDIVFVDQRGTGRSNRLDCPDDETSLAARLDPAQQLEALKRCLRALRSDLRQYATWIAVRDYDAVRERLGADRINLWGGSYGTRAALEYLRQFPQNVRTVVLDGPAPPDMVLPLAFAIDADAALTALSAACRVDAHCSARYPDFDVRVEALIRRARTGFDITVADPLTGRPQALHVDSRLIASLLRVPLYLPSLAAVLPYALAASGDGDYGPLVTLSAAVSSRLQEHLALGMHFAVVCAEDMPLIARSNAAAAASTRFGGTFVELYAEACAEVPTRPVPAEFFQVEVTDVPVLILSGGLDPATPPRHGAALAQRLGGRARHVVSPYLGHGVSAQACAPRLISQFVRSADAASLDTTCLERLPAPAFFEPVESAPPSQPAVSK